MFITEDPLNSIPVLLQEIKKFGDLAGFYVNKQKSKILCKNVLKKKQENIGLKTQCEVVNKVKYLGIYITSKNIDLYKNNYEKIWKEVKKDFIRWNKLNFSLMGRIAVVKMNVLPRLMFLLQTIPIIKNDKYFDIWHRDILEFVWAGKKPRIKRKVLYDRKERGGFQLPNIRLYYEAICLMWLRDWCLLKEHDMLNLEGYNNLFGWHAYLHYGKYQNDGNFSHHYIRNNLLRVWNKYKGYSGEGVPLWIVPLNVIKEERKEEKLLSYGDLLIWQGEEVNLLEDKMKDKYTWFECHQIRDLFLQDRSKGFRKQPSELEKIMLKDDVNISIFYDLLLKWFTEDEQVKTQMIKWAVNINKELSMDAWEYLWKTSMKISTCTCIKENCMKMIYRWYLTPKKLAKMDNTLSDRCWKCKSAEGSFYHMWWTCTKAQSFWTIIHQTMKKILKINLEKEPELFLLSMNLEKFKPIDRTLIWYMTAAARMLYAQKWKQEEIPDLTEWIYKMIHWCEMDKLSKKLRDQDVSLIQTQWAKFKDYLEDEFNMKEKCLFLNV